MTRPNRRRNTAADMWRRLGPGLPGECWIWPGGKMPSGYGLISIDGKTRLVHRLAWESANGREIPPGLQIDHTCRNRACANPAHLDVVTPRENVHRSDSPAALNARKTHCPKGHEYTAENTYAQSPASNGLRGCRACRRARLRAWREAKKQHTYQEAA